MSKATEVQKKPHGSGRDVAKLAQIDILIAPLIVPEKGFETVALWIRSAAAYLKARQLEETDIGPCGSSSGWLFTVTSRLHEDIEARAQLGEARYGERLRAFNGRDPLVDAYQEVLDAWMYLRQYAEEQEINK